MQMTTHGKMSKRPLGDGFLASTVSFGAMGMSEFYGTRPADEDSLTVLERALALGVTMFDTADMYGRGHNEQLIGRLLARHKAEYVAGGFAIATKFGIDRSNADPYKRGINNDPAYIRRSCEASLQRLGIDCIDLYYAHRVNPDVDISETIGVLSELVHEGKIAHIGLSEVSPATLRKAHAVHPVAAVQSEYSLWTRDVEASVLPVCRELGIGFVAYSPLGRGFLTGKYETRDSFEAGDFRLNNNPRFEGENFRRNLLLLPELRRIAGEVGCTPAQAALAWLLAKEERLVVIPGTRNISRLEENCAAAAVSLSREHAARLDAFFSPGVAHGERYSQEGMKGVNA